MDTKGPPPGFTVGANSQQPEQYPAPLPGGYPHQPMAGQPATFAHPVPPPPYDANANMIPPQQQQQQQYHHSQQLPGHTTTYVHVAAPPVGPDPTSITCPSCQKHVVTRLDYESSTKTHIMAGLLCLFICWPCFWIPYVVDSCKNANHYCPNCGAYIGTYRS